MEHIRLPIFEIQDKFEAAVSGARVVVTAPTGSGKSTELPRWLAVYGKVLVIEPRRVACLGLAERVSFLEQTTLGQKVGYHVRAGNRLGKDTQILFVTPGIALKYFSTGKLAEFDSVVLDEFHERGCETDLLVALLKRNFVGKLVVTSATINAVPLAAYLNAITLHAKGTLFPVEVKYLGPRDALPSADRLGHRVEAAINKAQGLEGDILVFLPGKGEIQRVADQLSGRSDLSVMRMHGDLGLGEQEKVFGQATRRKVVLATNVCETSITVPGIGVVIDSGLVKRTRFVDDRGFLTLMPIAADSADQRKGRAGRTAKGVCFRLWSERTVLEKYTPAEIFRESLTQMVLSAASCGEKMNTLDFFESPKPYAVEAAEQALYSLAALDDKQTITERGRALFGLPLRPEMAALLVDAEKKGMLPEAIDVVAAAETPKALFASPRRPQSPEDDYRLNGCDLRAGLLALGTNAKEFKKYELNGGGVREAVKLREELRRAFGVPREIISDVGSAPKLAETFIRTHPKSAYIARRKKGRLFFSNGVGKEIILSDASAIVEDKVEAIAVFSTVATGLGYREKDARIIVTLAAPLIRSQMEAANLGELRISKPQVKKNRVTATVERVYAGCVLSSREEIPKGDGAVSAILELFLRGSIFKKQHKETTRRLSEAKVMTQALYYKLCNEPLDLGAWTSDVPSVEAWSRNQLLGLGIESGNDLALLSEDDFLAPELPEWTGKWVRQHLPLYLNLGDVQYDVTFDFSKRIATLSKVSGTRKAPPSPNTVPSFLGFKIKVKHHTQTWIVRG